MLRKTPTFLNPRLLKLPQVKALLGRGNKKKRKEKSQLKKVLKMIKL